MVHFLIKKERLFAAFSLIKEAIHPILDNAIEKHEKQLQKTAIVREPLVPHLVGFACSVTQIRPSTSHIASTETAWILRSTGPQIKMDGCMLVACLHTSVMSLEPLSVWIPCRRQRRHKTDIQI
jgi:hypothetical protein